MIHYDRCAIRNILAITMINLNAPHRRLNPLSGEWVLVSPHRALRPWLGQIEKTPVVNLPPCDPTCYLCPGNSRAGGRINPDYLSTFVFDNDFSALLPSGVGPEAAAEVQFDKLASSLYQVSAETGICRVVCFSPRHDLTMPELSNEQVEAVIKTWIEQTRELGNIDYINYIQVFENKGEMMGCSNPHPHSQIWASSMVPNEPAKELTQQQKYLDDNGSCLLCDYLKSEIDLAKRIICQNEHFVVLAPYWAVWPFETIVISKRHMATLPELYTEEQTSLADIFRQITTRYDNLFEISFPYSMGFHQAPTDGLTHESWHLHAHFYPPLLRSATVRKFMVGFEMLAMPQRDLTPETAAERLRALSSIRFSQS